MAEKKQSNSLLNLLRNLNTSTKATGVQTYGIGRDPADIIASDMDEYIRKIRDDAESSDKQVINSKISRYKVRRDSTNETRKALYDIIKDQDTMNSIQTLIGTENIRFAQVMKDYEMVKRCLPQVHKVIVSLKNNILSPDGIADNFIGIEYPPNIDAATKEKISSLIDKYDLESKIQDWVLNYLIVSVKYVTVIPFAEIPDMLENGSVINESVEEIEARLGKPRSLFEAANASQYDQYLNESVSFTQNAVVDGEITEATETVEISKEEINEAINNTLKSIEFIDGGREYYKRAILNEAIYVASKIDNDDKSMKSVLNSLKKSEKQSTKILSAFNNVNDGMVTKKDISDIRKKVDFHGCHIEELPAEKVIPFKIRNTTIGYFYAEDKYDAANDHSKNLSTIMDKINSSVYMRTDSKTSAEKVEQVAVRAITDKLLKAINYKFINDNYDDMDIIYEFVKENMLYNNKKKVTFFHPDDISEIIRKDGSIMKNCMFFAKLYILTLLNNVITNVTRGGDRQMYYVKTGLTSDIEGAVNSTIRSIKQNQIRYSDMGTINEIFNLVGTTVDVFMPVSVDGDRPIETETVPGQQVDMNNEFLQWMMRSIILGFGAPASVIDDFENIEYAKTITMSNLDMAKLVLDAQKELEKPLSKIFQLIVAYELPEFTNFEAVRLKLTPPSVIVYEMNRQRIEGIATMADALANLLITPMDETMPFKRMRLFKLEYFKKNMPGIDWDEIDSILKKVETSAIEEIQKENISGDTVSPMPPPEDDGYGGGY